MPTNTVRRFLYSQDVRYARITFSEDIQTLFKSGCDKIKPEQIARAHLLKDFRGLMMAIIPAPSRLNIPALNQVLHRNLQEAESSDFSGIFFDCVKDSIPPLGEAYNIETIIDDKLLRHDFVYFASGEAHEMIRISAADFRLLHSNAWYGNTFSKISHPLPVFEEVDDNLAPDPSVTDDLQQLSKQLVQSVNRLPPMPGIAQQIFELEGDPEIHAQDLADLIEQDPSLCAQIIRFAQSPFYGYNGKIQSVRQAISRVLGFDLVMNIALGIALAKPFKIPSSGPLGLKNYWRHATYSAALEHGLCHLIPRTLRPRPGSAFLCGLLHNIGILIMGHFQPQAFAELNKLYASGEYRLSELEDRLFGSHHSKIGLMLMEKWNMPDYICASVAHHHNENYDGIGKLHSQLTMIADRLLKIQDIGDGDTDLLPGDILAQLGLSEAQAYSMLDKTLHGSKDLDSMANQLAA